MSALEGTEHSCPWCSLFIPRLPRAGRSHLPVIKAAGPHQKQSSHGHPALLFNRGEAAGEIYEEYQEKRDIPATTNKSIGAGMCLNPPKPNHAQTRRFLC